MKAAVTFFVVTVFTTLFLESSAVPVDSGSVIPDQQIRDCPIDYNTKGISSSIKEITKNVIGNIRKTVGKAGETMKNVVTGTIDIIGEVSNYFKNMFEHASEAVAGIAAGGIETTKHALIILANYQNALGTKANALIEALAETLGDVNKELIQKPLKEFIANGIASTESALAKLRQACEDALTKATGKEKAALTEVNNWLKELDAKLYVLNRDILAVIRSGTKEDLRKVILRLSKVILHSTADAAKYSATLVASPGDQTGRFLFTFGEKFTLMGSNAALGLQGLRLLYFLYYSASP